MLGVWTSVGTLSIGAGCCFSGRSTGVSASSGSTGSTGAVVVSSEGPATSGSATDERGPSEAISTIGPRRGNVGAAAAAPGVSGTASAVGLPASASPPPIATARMTVGIAIRATIPATTRGSAAVAVVDIPPAIALGHQPACAAEAPELEAPAVVPAAVFTEPAARSGLASWVTAPSSQLGAGTRTGAAPSSVWGETRRRRASAQSGQLSMWRLSRLRSRTVMAPSHPSRSSASSGQALRWWRATSNAPRLRSMVVRKRETRVLALVELTPSASASSRPSRPCR